MDRPSLVIAGSSALIGAGAALIVAPNQILGWGFLVLGLVGFLYGFMAHLEEKQNMRETAFQEYGDAADALYDLLGEKYANEVGLQNAYEGELALQETLKEVGWPSPQDWKVPRGEEARRLKEFLIGTLGAARNEERVTLRGLRVELGKQHLDWSRALESNAPPNSRFIPWLTDIARNHQHTTFILWAYLEWAVTEIKPTMSDPDFTGFREIIQRWT